MFLVSLLEVVAWAMPFLALGNFFSVYHGEMFIGDADATLKGYSMILSGAIGNAKARALLGPLVGAIGVAGSVELLNIKSKGFTYAYGSFGGALGMPTKSFSVDYLGYVWNVTEPEHYTKWFWSTSFSGFLRFLPGSHPLWDFFKGASGGSVFLGPWIRI